MRFTSAVACGFWCAPWREGTTSSLCEPARCELLDVRAPIEQAVEQVPDAVNTPLEQLRARLGELPRDREILVTCRSGLRAYYATRLLLQHGFKARNLTGGLLSRAILSEHFAEDAPRCTTTSP